MLGCQQQLIGSGQALECPITRLPGSPFETGTGPHLDMNHLQRHTQGSTDRLTVGRPSIRRRLQPVMNMHSREPWKAMLMRQIDKEMQQDGGIKSTGESDAPMSGFTPGRQAF
ncbi:hypothetical protein PproGo58_11680 [Pseudomonas protegens]|nr:hypothetical protein PproGo58_11680 [Pseudomonas protegens]